MVENKCCATCKNFAEYKIKNECGELVDRCGCEYYDMTADRSAIDVNKCNCVDNDGWELGEDGKEN